MIRTSRLRSERTRNPRSSAAGLRAVLTHRLFPGLCALWFAALFGLGCLVAGNAALGGLVVALHLPAVLPAAAPPLGLTARLVLALALAGIGGALGLGAGLVLFARAGGQLPVRTAVQPAAAASVQSAPEPAMRVRSRDAHPDAPPRRPLVVTEDVLPYPTAMVETPPPGEDRDHADLDPKVDHGDLPPFLAAAYASMNPLAQTAPAGPAVHESVAVAPLATKPEPAKPEPAKPEPAVSETSAPVAVAPLATKPEPAAAMAPIEPAAAPEPVVSAPPLASLAAAAPKVPLTQLPLGGLGLVQLIERLAQAIAVRQQHRAAALEAAVASDLYDMRTPLHRFDPLTMDPSGPLLRAKKGRAAGHDALPDPLAAAVDLGEEAGHGDDAHEPAPEHERTHDDGALEPTVEHRYSSLTDMALPRPELVSFDAPADDSQAEAVVTHDPVVPFPSRLPGGETAQPAASADRALRDALATLRQMTAHR